MNLVADSSAALATALNTWFWIISNGLVFLVFVAAALFSIAYPLLFKIETTGGWRLWRAMVSIAGFGLLSVLAIFVDPTTGSWLELPPGVAWWRPLVRLLIFGVIAHSFASLTVYLWQRRFHPKSITVRPEIVQLLEVELRLSYGSGSGLPDPHEIAERLAEKGWTKAGLSSAQVPVNTFGVTPRKFHRG